MENIKGVAMSHSDEDLSNAKKIAESNIQDSPPSHYNLTSLDSTKIDENEAKDFLNPEEIFNHIETDIVIQTVKQGIDDFAEKKKSLDLKNIHSEYVPIAIDKIMELSSDVIIFDGTGDFLEKYKSVIQRNVGNKKRFRIYSAYSIQKYSSDISFNIIPVNKNTTDELMKENIRSAIIGDGMRYRVEEANEKSDTISIKNWFLSLFGKEIVTKTDSKEYKSLTNFNDSDNAQKLLRIITRHTTLAS